jgi:hypothetical protein
MDPETRVNREFVVDIDAATVGISSRRWKFIASADATAERAAEIMREFRFDTLPIVGVRGSAEEYFHTVKWNHYSDVKRSPITKLDSVPFMTPLKDMIQKFVVESRNFYFLDNEDSVVGLISIANLNCRQVKVYLYSLLSELEIKLGDLLGAIAQSQNYSL